MTDLLLRHDHIDALISIALRWGNTFDESMVWAANDPNTIPAEEISYREITGQDDPLFLDDIGTMLLLENARSVEYRYRETTEVEPYNFRPVYTSWLEEAEMCFRPIDAYSYYSSEHPGWPSSEAFRFCQALTESLIISLPHYGLGPWIWRRS